MIEDIKTKIKNGQINEAMAEAITEAMKIEIVTCLLDENQQPSNASIRSVIDLLNNEIDYQISEELIDDNFASQIKKIHHQQMLEANERMVKNIESLQTMFSMINNTLSDLSDK